MSDHLSPPATPGSDEGAAAPDDKLAPAARKLALRRNDFWTALALMAASSFFIGETFEIPFYRANAAGVEAGRWYNSAALVPFGVFTGLFILSTALLYVAIRDGGAPRGLKDIPIKRWALSRDGARIIAATVIMLAYIFALTPRTDFILSSALVLSALIYAFHTGRAAAIGVSTAAVLAPSAYALIMHFPQSKWATPHDDDWLVLGAFASLALFMFAESYAAEKRLSQVIRWTPVVAIVAPLILVTAMAFGFRQNVPNRTGLLFQQIEYHWFVTVKPVLFG